MTDQSRELTAEEAFDALIEALCQAVREVSEVLAPLLDALDDRKAKPPTTGPPRRWSKNPRHQ